MGVAVAPHERDDSSGISRLTVKYSSGAVETPFRFVNRHDLQAKSNIGVNVGVTVGNRAFVYEHHVNPKGIDSILHTNDYLATATGKIESTLNRVDDGSLTVVYLKLTQDAKQGLKRDSTHAKEVVAFLLNIVGEVEADAFALQYDVLGPEEWAYIRRQSRPIVPVVDIGDSRMVDDALAWIPGESSSIVPFLGVTYASYRSAYLSYKSILASRQALHESGKGVMVLQALRTVPTSAEAFRDLSAPHYASFLIADAVGERYSLRIPPKERPKGGPRIARLFRRSELALPAVAPGTPLSEYAGEDAPFSGDPKVYELFKRTAQGLNTPEDWKDNRPPSLSRLHETINSASEYELMREALVKSELGAYMRQKRRLSELIGREREGR